MRPLLLTLLLLALFRPAAAQTYTVTDLGGFYPSAINNVGQVVGDDTLWEAGRTIRIPRLVLTCRARAINDKGQIIGTSGSGVYHGMEEERSRAFLWQNGSLKDLGTPGNPAAHFHPNGINDRGQIVGDCYPYAILWESGRFTRLTALPKVWPDGTVSSIATGINDCGQVVGLASPINGESYAVLWQSGRLTTLARIHGNHPGGALTRSRGFHQGGANAINERGQIIGEAGDASSEFLHAVFWQSGKCLDLGLLPGETESSGLALNNVGQMVGKSSHLGRTQYLSRAFLWRGGKMLDLNALLPPHSGWHLDAATGINDRGRIIGYGTHNGKPRGFLLTPNP